MNVITHSGKFHADDVLAYALLRHFHPLRNQMALTRTRDPQIIERADIVFDVGGIYDPTSGRFDHHQNEYTGPLSSAGMVLAWLIESNWIDTELGQRLHHDIVEYVDDVDNGRVEERANVPCFSRMVSLFTASANTLIEFDQQFHKAVSIASGIIEGVEAKYNLDKQAKQFVLTAMNGPREFSNIIEFPQYLSWKGTYYAHGGETHPTEFVMYPTMYETWQVSAIPPTIDSFAQKRSFPESWAGLRDEELSAVTGTASIFCHKNRFIAVFKTKKDAIDAMKHFGLIVSST